MMTIRGGNDNRGRERGDERDEERNRVGRPRSERTARAGSANPPQHPETTKVERAAVRAPPGARIWRRLHTEQQHRTGVQYGINGSPPRKKGVPEDSQKPGRADARGTGEHDGGARRERPP